MYKPLKQEIVSVLVQNQANDPRHQHVRPKRIQY